jgi:hypothetical protein
MSVRLFTATQQRPTPTTFECTTISCTLLIQLMLENQMQLLKASKSICGLKKYTLGSSSGQDQGNSIKAR